MYKLFIKRTIDIVLSLILIILTSPIMLIVACIVRSDGGPAIFIQKRSGRKNKIFSIYKFRSMTVSNDVHDFKKENSMTKVGQFLKNTSLDELPQLFNIFKGDMSFIGPRPWIIDYSYYFNSEQMRRLDVRPGLTGLAQCNGRNNISVKEKIKYDLEYVDNLSFLMDVSIVIKTIKSVFSKDGSSASKMVIKKELEDLKRQNIKQLMKGLKYE